MIEHRKELREKVETRQNALGAALKASEAAGHPADRITALSTEISVAKDSLSGGWDTMTDKTAEHLSAWLEATKNLVTDEKPKSASVIVPPTPAGQKLKEVSAPNGSKV